MSRIIINMYDEFGPGMGLPHMSDFFEPEPYNGIDKIIDYLEKGQPTFVSGKVAKDIYSGKVIPVEYCGMTDGKYSWMSVLPYYVKTYNLRLPQEFENYVLSNWETT